MDYFLYFLLGIIFIQWIVPIGDEFANLIISFLETLKCNAGIKVAKANVEIHKLSSNEVSHVIGFKVDSDNEKWEEEEEAE